MVGQTISVTWPDATLGLDTFLYKGIEVDDKCYMIHLLWA